MGGLTSVISSNPKHNNQKLLRNDNFKNHNDDYFVNRNVLSLRFFQNGLEAFLVTGQHSPAWTNILFGG
jgi:hypothetical protein